MYITTRYRRLSKILVLLSLGFWITSSCKSDKEQEKIIINPLAAIEREVRLSYFTDDISYIHLDNEILFQHPNWIETNEDRFIIKVFPGGILAFDRFGNFLNTIGREGTGPGEYQMALFFSIDSGNEIVYVNDNLTNKILVYSFEGKFIREFSLSIYGARFDDLHYYQGKLYLANRILYGYAKYSWLIVDTLGNLYSYKINPITKFETNRGSSGGFFLGPEEGLYFWTDHNDTIFFIQDSIYQPAMFFNPGGFKQPQARISSEDFINSFVPRTLKGTHNFIFHSYYLKKQLHSTYIDRRNGQMSIIGKTISLSGFDLPGIPNDIDGGPAFPPLFYFQEKNEEFMIGWVHAHRLKAYVASEAFKTSSPKYPEKKKELEELAASIDENDNPVLMLVKLKE
jgi:hypothetical protein